MSRSKEDIEHDTFIVAASFHIPSRDHFPILTQSFNAHFFHDRMNLAWPAYKVKYRRNRLRHSEKQVLDILTHAQTYPWYDDFRLEVAQKNFEKRWSEFEAQLRKQKIKEHWKDALRAGGEKATDKLQPGPNLTFKKEEVNEAEEEVKKPEEEAEEAGNEGEEVKEEGVKVKEEHIEKKWELEGEVEGKET